jgi:hypothetical protein
VTVGEVPEFPFPSDESEPWEDDHMSDASAAVGGLGAKSAAAFLAETIADPRWLAVDILPERAIGFIGGAPKVMKSWLALDLAMAVATGSLFCGRFLCPAPRSVLVYQLESARAAYQRRVRTIATRYGGAPENLYVVSNEPVLFEDPVGIGRMEVTLGELRPDLLIIDPLAAMTTGDENSAQEMGRIVRQLRAWRDAYGCAIAVVHHTNKAAGGAEKMRSGLKLRGSSVFFAATEWALWVERPDDSAPRLEVRVEQKESEPRRPFAVEFLENGAQLVVVADEISVQVKDDEIVDAIVARKRSATAQELANDLGMSERTVRDRMALLVRGRRAYIEAGSGKGRKPTVYVVPRGTQSGPRLLSEPTS